MIVATVYSHMTAEDHAVRIGDLYIKDGKVVGTDGAAKCADALNEAVEHPGLGMGIYTVDGPHNNQWLPSDGDAYMERLHLVFKSGYEFVVLREAKKEEERHSD